MTTTTLGNAATPSFINTQFDHPGPKPPFGGAGYTKDETASSRSIATTCGPSARRVGAAQHHQQRRQQGGDQVPPRAAPNRRTDGAATGA